MKIISVETIPVSPPVGKFEDGEAACDPSSPTSSEPRLTKRTVRFRG